MKAVLCRAPGLPETLTIGEIDDPIPGPRQVVVAVHAASVNFPDVLMVQDLYQFKAPHPFSPGSELAGVVESLGSEVAGLQVGDRVVANVLWGAFAEKIALDAASVVKVPETVPLQTAAAVLLTYGTTVHALEDRADLRAGETLLVLGASGGVGIAAVQLGKVLGARVIAAASSAEKLAVALACGADAGIDYSKEDLKTRVKELTGGAGANVIFDPVGGPYSEAALRSIAWEGRHLVVGFAAGEIPKIPLNLALLKGCQIVGVFWGSFATREPQRNALHIEKIFRLLEEQRIAPHIHRVYSLAQTPLALDDLRLRRAVGKVMIEIRPSPNA